MGADEGYALQRALAHRRSNRTLQEAVLTLNEVSQLLWAAQGITSPAGFRTAPSAGALYPLEMRVLAGAVRDLEVGVYRYVPSAHGLTVLSHADVRGALARAAYGQDSVEHNAVLFLVSGIEQRTSTKYGNRAARYVHMEAGHAAQNLLLQVTALGLGAVVIGAFDDSAVRGVMNLPRGEEPLYLIPLGRV